MVQKMWKKQKISFQFTLQMVVVVVDVGMKRGDDSCV